MYIEDGGNIGIGTTSPTEKLVLMGNLSVNNSARASNTLFVDSTAGRVGIGTDSPSQKLEVAGHINVTGTTSNSTFVLMVRD